HTSLFSAVHCTRMPPLSLHDALPIWELLRFLRRLPGGFAHERRVGAHRRTVGPHRSEQAAPIGVVTIALAADVPFPEAPPIRVRSEEHTSELQSREKHVCRLLLEIKK